MRTDINLDETLVPVAIYVAHGRERGGQACIPDLKTRYGISAAQAIEAVRLANRFREAAYARQD